MQRRGLAFLFAVIFLALLVVAAGAFEGASGAKRWVIGLAALALAAWMASLAGSLIRRR